MANVPFRNLELSNLSFRQLQYISTNNSTTPNGFFLAGVNNIIVPRDPLNILSSYSGVDCAYLTSSISTINTQFPPVSTTAANAALGVASLGISLSTVSTTAGRAYEGVNSLGVSLSTVSTTAGQALNMSGSISSISTFTGLNTIEIMSLGATTSTQSTLIEYVTIGLSTVSTAAGLDVGATGPTGPTGPTGDISRWAESAAVANVRCGFSTLQDVAQFNQGSNNLMAAQLGSVFGQYNSTYGTGSLVAGFSNKEFATTGSPGYNFVAGSSNYVSTSYSVTVGLRNSNIGIYTLMTGSANLANLAVANSFISGCNNRVSRSINSFITGSSNFISTIETASVSLSQFMSGASNTTLTSLSHTEGRNNSTLGYGSHVEGTYNVSLIPYSHTFGLATRSVYPCSQTYGNGFFLNGSAIPIIGSAQTNIVTMTCGTNAAGTYKSMFYWNPLNQDIYVWNTNWSTISTLVMSNDNYPMAQTYNIALTAYNSNSGGTAGKGYYYAEYKASLYFDTPANTLYIGNIIGNTFTAAASSPVTLTATSAANNLANAPTITVRARANVLNAASNAAHIGFEVASSDSRVTSYYAHIRIDELVRPQIDPFY